MIEKRHVEQILRINGLATDSSDDDIKSILIGARWHEDDVETALVVLRENTESKVQHIDSFHNVYHSSAQLNPETLSAILGIDVEVESITNSRRNELIHAYKMQIFGIAVFSVLLALSSMLFIMWYMKVGVFFSVY
jgi:hypothetical protein